MPKQWRPATVEDLLRRMPKPKPATIKQVPGQPFIFIKRTPKCPK